MPALRIAIRRLPHSLTPTVLPLPSRATPLAAGLDLRAALDIPLSLSPGLRARIPTGFIVAVPEGYEGQVRPRSGRAWADGLTVLNAPGTVDADYRGELHVLLVNLGQTPVLVERGDRIAQLVVAPVVSVELIEVDAVDETRRGGGGFGHTGT